MGRALELAQGVKGSTLPNPAVGAVVVTGDRIVGSGATAPWGQDHAEKTACAAAGKNARGATLYVTLEPCNHTGKTPPCTEAILASGVRKVVVAMTDPNPIVSGKGIAKLRRTGVTVRTGLLRTEAQRLNEDYCWTIQNRRPWITLKLALTLDGRIADYRGRSKWITGKEARGFVHDLRRRHGAVAVGRKTLSVDDPSLTVRHVQASNPARIVFTSARDVPRNARFCDHRNPGRRILVISGGPAAAPRIEKTGDGIERWLIGAKDRNTVMDRFCTMALEQRLSSILVEGGARFASFLLEHGWVNRLYCFFGPLLLGGGTDGVSFAAPRALEKACTLYRVEHEGFGPDGMVTGLLKRER